ncbi:helix-turn-helix transcriptional regulator [Flavobacterium sp. CS20]|jgi:transcriptional regulator with XRE-family HTH domain|uniref:helix-turn-helix transcriptional regulator n=1 Tax=Flavobacterium sp. CS20 TaxID=2775246 RepID=UPI001B3A599C|nr:helix-turn-helix transcriptional regulator [Flavobacterium sp. CS20]QTY26321.1 helix-turn-helix transcriptional regulator [Flavobacterium sp. CS20]
MIKQKLIKARKEKGATQKEIADVLCMGVSNYSRKEKGVLGIRDEEWVKIADFLQIPLEDIYEDDRKQVFICKDQAVGLINGTNNIYTKPEYILESQRKYIEKLEIEIKELKQKLSEIN